VGEDDAEVAVEEDVAAQRGNVVLSPVSANIPVGSTSQTASINPPTSSGQQPQPATVLSEADKVNVTDPRSALRQAKLLAEELNQPYKFVLRFFCVVLYIISDNKNKDVIDLFLFVFVGV
jgi:hypothetical protein